MDNTTRGRLDTICIKQTAFKSFEELINAGGNYRPSLEVTDFDRYFLAECYDAWQEGAGDDRRAFRYGGPNSGIEAVQQAERAAHREHIEYLIDHPTTPVEAAKSAKARARSVIRTARRQNRWHFTHRGVEILPCDAAGARIGDGDILELSELSGKALRNSVAGLRKYTDSYDGDFVTVGIAGGLDCWDSLQDQLKGYDYEPGFEYWDITVPVAAFD